MNKRLITLRNLTLCEPGRKVWTNIHCFYNHPITVIEKIYVKRRQFKKRSDICLQGPPRNGGMFMLKNIPYLNVLYYVCVLLYVDMNFYVYIYKGILVPLSVNLLRLPCWPCLWWKRNFSRHVSSLLLFLLLFLLFYYYKRFQTSLRFLHHRTNLPFVVNGSWLFWTP